MSPRIMNGSLILTKIYYQKSVFLPQRLKVVRNRWACHELRKIARSVDQKAFAMPLVPLPVIVAIPVD